ncbi:MAG: preprotein translocase subunit SecE [Solirubrobacteraceae bacterium]|jgi:preprotein translocase SecE subunit|nr:preprotein translocase subunit SecE [Solirubrobacteraceae bacterium]
MARHRQRAKDRKQKLHRENIPGSLDHASGEVEEVEAAIVAGARGKPVEPAPDDRAGEPVDATEPAPAPVADEALEPLEELEPADDEPDTDSERDADAATVEHGRLGKGAGDLAVTPDAHKPAGFRVTNFFRACWAELQRVDWPDRRQVGQATAVVLGFVVVAGAFLGLADVVAQRVVDLIL